MAGSTTKLLTLADAEHGKLTYSMSRRGQRGYDDCSSFLYRMMIGAGFLPKSTPLGNTETIFKLKGTVLREIDKTQIRAGDIFNAGWEGASLGSAGHTGIMRTAWNGNLRNMKITHCSYSFGSKNVVTTQAKNYMGDYSGLPVRYFRFTGANNGGQIIGQENVPQMMILAVDGMWGPKMTVRLQEYLGMSIRDGVISHQYRQKCNQYIYAAQFDTSLMGSQMIYALQARLKEKGFYTGKLDGLCGSETIKALQRAFGTPVDGYISSVSTLVCEMQKALNANKLPI